MALRADERRDKLRKASGRSKYPLIRRYLNGETRLSNPQSPYSVNWKDAVEFMLAGASAIQIGTANFIDPAVTVKVVEGINALKW